MKIEYWQEDTECKGGYGHISKRREQAPDLLAKSMNSLVLFHKK